MNNNGIDFKFHYKAMRHLVLYGIIGILASSIDFSIYMLLVQVAGWQYIIANCVSILVGLTTSFTLNRKYNFKVKDNTRKRFFLFVTVGLAGLLMSNLILYACVNHFVMNKLIAKLLSIIMVVYFQFLANKHLTFRSTKQKKISNSK